MIAMVAMIQQEVRWLSDSLKHPDVSKIKQSNVEFILLKTSNCLHVELDRREISRVCSLRNYAGDSEYTHL